VSDPDPKSYKTTGTTTVFPGEGDPVPGRRGERPPAPALVIAWSVSNPEQIGEVIPLPRGSSAPPVVLGRGPGRSDDDVARVHPVHQRPGRNRSAPPLSGPSLSRRQLLIRVNGSRVEVENVGRCPLRYRGERIDRTIVMPGDVLELEDQLVLLCEPRPMQLPATRSWPSARIPAFGDPDAFGFVGESPAAWALREHLAFFASRPVHVLLLGLSGTGKELAALTLHGLSDRGRRTLVSRNAATFPEGLVDAELFGNRKDYPNPGMAARQGLVGRADGSTLFLDEIGELDERLQAHLLRLLDSGEYQRLGEDETRNSDLRLIAATNRSPTELKHDLLARLKVRVLLPPLEARRSDIPLIARYLLRGLMATDPELAGRFATQGADPLQLEPRLSTALAAALVGHRYRLEVRELETLLWTALASSESGQLELTPEVRAQLDAEVMEEESTSPRELTPEAIQACLDRNHGNQERAWRDLGLKNRWVLVRLIKKHGLVVKRTR